MALDAKEMAVVSGGDGTTKAPKSPLRKAVSNSFDNPSEYARKILQSRMSEGMIQSATLPDEYTRTYSNKFAASIPKIEEDEDNDLDEEAEEDEEEQEEGEGEDDACFTGDVTAKKQQKGTNSKPQAQPTKKA